MAGSRRMKRRIFRLVIVILTLALLAIIGGGTFLWWRYTSRQAQSTGYFKVQPVLQEDFRAQDYGIESFLPLWGQQSSIRPVTYGDYRIGAGVTGDGSGVILQLSTDGTSSWSVNLGAPIAACAQQTLGGANGDHRHLPCLYHSGNGSGIALVDLKMGTARWIWESTDSYANIATQGSQIVLVGEDLSLLRLSDQGEQLAEGLVSQKASDPQLQPDPGNCNLDGKPTEQAPETFETFSDTLWVIGHKGINYLVDPETNQIQAASPGRLIRNADDTAWALSPADGCTRSLFIQPQRTRVTTLPQGTTVPTDTSGQLLDLVQKGGKLFRMDWEKLRSLRALFDETEMKLGAGTQVLPTTNSLYVSSDNQLGCYSRKSGKEIWSFSEKVKQMRLHQDVLLYTTEEGLLKAVSTADGIELWSVSAVDNSFLESIKEDKKLQTLSPAGFQTWGRQVGENQTVGRGAANPMTAAEPGFSVPIDSCIRVSDTKGSGSSYQVQFNRVSCQLKGAEKVIRIIDTGQIDRGKPASDYLKKCLEDPQATSAITVTSAIADPKTSALCTGQVASGR
ncbi:PQQ-binding-like beta-propeller repeat protein [uncultured Varibaculum sp.]|uniref:outer membrane protein assembly factor BamB family protein n=1 Tax=uncultured Varibaculum sp. TaxID=413896 RepID=UPI0027D9ADC8|nr:PQQ-binding-like beta-propeller repeat protein [uncultured Varibaculum sp.]